MRLSFSALASATFILYNALFTSASANYSAHPTSPRHISPLGRHRNRAANLPANWALVGCFTDAISHRALASYSTTSGSNTPASCMSTCLSKGYSLAGVEYGKECHCGNSVVTGSNPSTGQPKPASECSTACSGDRSQTCGAGNRLQIYTYTAPLPSGWKSLGCYTDSISKRALASYHTTSNSNTPGSCAKTCAGKGYKYTGVEYGNECWCSNTLTTSSSTGQPVASSQCNMHCAGNSYTTCGAGNRIGIYSSASGLNWKSLGCFTDASTRALSGANTNTNSNTPSSCMSYCNSKGYTLAGVEDGKQCWCSSKLAYSGGAGQPADSSKCSTPCTGDSSLKCGGGWLLNIYASPAYLSSSQSIWKLKDNYSGSSFFDQWSFFSFPDPTHGNVDFQNANNAWSSGLVSINGAGHAVMKVDTTPVVSGNRKSVRIQTNKQYTGGLFMIDAVHMPVACGAWPAFWTVGPTNWPANGEIDILEGVHVSTQNQMSIHTGPGCTMPPNYGATGTLTGSTNCDSAATGNTGCGLRSNQPGNYGAPYNSNGGGIHMMKWDSSGISIWFFQRGQIPSDITLGLPQPSTWGTPAGNYPASTCNPSTFFNNHVVVLDTTLCGDWAGASNVWNVPQAGTSQSCAAITGYSTCSAYIRAQGAAFASAYWEIASVKVYQQN